MEKHLKWVYWAAREVRVSVRNPLPCGLPCDLEKVTAGSSLGASMTLLDLWGGDPGRASCWPT